MPKGAVLWPDTAFFDHSIQPLRYQICRKEISGYSESKLNNFDGVLDLNRGSVFWNRVDLNRSTFLSNQEQTATGGPLRKRRNLELISLDMLSYHPVILLLDSV